MKKVKIDSKGCVNSSDRVEWAEGQDEIVEKFREVYESLYKSKLQTLIGPDSLAEVDKITGDVVKKAATLMKSGKSDVSGAFTSDLLLNGPDSLFDSLAAIFRSSLVQ